MHIAELAPDYLAHSGRYGRFFPGRFMETTFHSQSTFIFPVQGQKDTFVYMGDRWTPDNAIDGRYIWLPIKFEGERFVIEWKDKWSLDDFN